VQIRKEDVEMIDGLEDEESGKDGGKNEEREKEEEIEENKKSKKGLEQRKKRKAKEVCTSMLLVYDGSVYWRFDVKEFGDCFFHSCVLGLASNGIFVDHKSLREKVCVKGLEMVNDVGFNWFWDSDLKEGVFAELLDDNCIKYKEKPEKYFTKYMNVEGSYGGSGGLWKDGMRYVVLILNIVNLCAFDYV